jgi:hypothetical protein
MITALMNGAGGLVPGDIVEGERAKRYLAAGYAIPVVETRKAEKAVRSGPTKETR